MLACVNIDKCFCKLNGGDCPASSEVILDANAYNWWYFIPWCVDDAIIYHIPLNGCRVFNYFVEYNEYRRSKIRAPTIVKPQAAVYPAA